MCEHNVHTALSGRAPLNVVESVSTAAPLTAAESRRKAIALESETWSFCSKSFAGASGPDEGRQPSSVEVAHEGLQRDRRWWILKSESVKRNEKISNETTHP